LLLINHVLARQTDTTSLKLNTLNQLKAKKEEGEHGRVGCNRFDLFHRGSQPTQTPITTSLLKRLA
jgi:hypothetical protein